MTNYKAISAIAVAAVKMDILLTTVQIAAIADELEAAGVIKTDQKPAANKPITGHGEGGSPSEMPHAPAIPVGGGKTKAKIEHVKKPRKKSGKPTMDEILENAKMPDHVNIQPEDPERKPLTPKEQTLYAYMKKFPDATMPIICRELGLSMANYYLLKGKIKQKGWIHSGVVDDVKAFDPIDNHELTGTEA